LDKLFDAVLANIVVWSTLLFLVVSASDFNASFVKRRLEAMQSVISAIGSGDRDEQLDIVEVKIGNTAPLDSQWCFVFVRSKSDCDDLEIEIIKG